MTRGVLAILDRCYSATREALSDDFSSTWRERKDAEARAYFDAAFYAAPARSRERVRYELYASFQYCVALLEFKLPIFVGGDS